MDQIPELLYEDPERAVSQLESLLAKAGQEEPSLTLLELACEVYFELGLAEQARIYLRKAVALDPTGKKSGDFTKFLWLGQLEGGRDGLAHFELGLAGVKSPEQVVQALLGMVEIWMTDLCMEPEAESQCETLIARACLADETNPEVWSILGSIRISQQREEEAKIALQRSWNIYQQQLQGGELHVSQIPALLRLCRSLVEVELYDLSLDVSAEIATLDDQIPDSCYLNAIAHSALAHKYSESEPNLSIKHLKGAHLAFSLLSGMPDVDPEMINDIQGRLSQFGEPPADLSGEDESDSEVENENDTAMV